MDLVEAQRDVERRGAGLPVLPAEVVEELVAGDGEVAHAALEEIAGERGLGRDDSSGGSGQPPTSRKRAPSRQRFSSYAPFWGRIWAMARRSTA